MDQLRNDQGNASRKRVMVQGDTAENAKYSSLTEPITAGSAQGAI